MQKYPKLLEEIFNSITHGIGFVIFLSAIFCYFIFRNNFTVWHVAGISVFGVSLLFLYSMSTLYHSLFFTRARPVFLSLDGSAVFFLIAGTYTPFLLTVLRGNVGLILLPIVWGTAVVGIFLHVLFFKKLKVLLVTLELALGWGAIIMMQFLHQLFSNKVLLLLIAGGVWYSVGIIFYSWKKLPYSHTIWHIFVTIGSMFHFLAVCLL